MPEIFQGDEKESLQERCGIVAVYSPSRRNLLPFALTAANGVQHRGQNGVGVTMQTENGLITRTADGLLRDLPKNIVEELDQPALWGLVHCRYGTSGGYDKYNLQPCTVKSELGEFAVIHNGQFTGIDKMKKSVKGDLPPDASDTYIFTQLLAQSPGATVEEKVINALSQVNGAYSLMIGIGDKLFLARDGFGIRPLVIGQTIENGWIAASETHALGKVDVSTLREVKRGELIRIDQSGLQTLMKGHDGQGNFCELERAYIHRPDSLLSTYEHRDDFKHPERWQSPGLFREECGRTVARENPISNASFIVGIPDSGIAFATGYAQEMNKLYRQLILRDHFDPNANLRLFMADFDINSIAGKILGKLSFLLDSKLWKDAIVVLGDDSIIRGNVSEQITKAVFSLGAKEVHWVLGYPMVTHTCHLGVSLRTPEELIAAQENNDPVKIAKKIGATSVSYISNRGFIQARKPHSELVIPSDERNIFLANGGCGGCVTGLYPIDEEGKIYQYGSAKSS